MKARIGISRASNDKVYIRITDDVSGIEFVEIKLTLEDYALAITGLHGVEGEASYKGLEKVGKQRVTEHRSVVCPIDTYDTKILKSWLEENCQEEGWILNSYLGSKDSIVRKDAQIVLNYRVARFVEV